MLARTRMHGWKSDSERWMCWLKWCKGKLLVQRVWGLTETHMGTHENAYGDWLERVWGFTESFMGIYWSTSLVQLNARVLVKSIASPRSNSSEGSLEKRWGLGDLLHSKECVSKIEGECQLKENEECRVKNVELGITQKSQIYAEKSISFISDISAWQIKHRTGVLDSSD